MNLFFAKDFQNSLIQLNCLAIACNDCFKIVFLSPVFHNACAEHPE